MRRCLPTLLLLALGTTPAAAQPPGYRLIAPAPRPAPYPTPYVQPVAAINPYPAAGGGEAGAFLASLNQWRAWHGRGPLGWSATLAGYAATNAGVHQPGSSGGGAQCWAGTGSLLAALELWKRSPAHAAILLGAVAEVGASPCPSGSTANAR